MRTRVKFCGFTRAVDVHTAVALGVDALGFVLYERSPRCVSPEQLSELCAHVPAFVSTVGLFVNASTVEIAAVLRHVPLQNLQLHGDEGFAFALDLQTQLRVPVIKAVRVNAQTDWDEISHYSGVLAGILLDSDSAGYGGSGHGFDWQLIPPALRGNIILSGGLTVDTVGAAMTQVHPYALDVSSGIEAGHKGIKDAAFMTAFMTAVQIHQHTD